MPKYPECLISGLLIWWFLLLLLKKHLGNTQFVLDLWADATGPKHASAKRGSLASLGFSYRLNDKCKIKWGQWMSQQPLYPPSFANSGQHISSYGLKLQAVEWNSWNVILNLGNIWLQVCNVQSLFFLYFIWHLKNNMGPTFSPHYGTNLCSQIVLKCSLTKLGISVFPYSISPS